MLKGCPINRKISATVSVEMLPVLDESKLLKAFCRTEKEGERVEVEVLRCSLKLKTEHRLSDFLK